MRITVTHLLGQCQEALLQFSGKLKVVGDLLVLRQRILQVHQEKRIKIWYHLKKPLLEQDTVTDTDALFYTDVTLVLKIIFVMYYYVHVCDCKRQ